MNVRRVGIGLAASATITVGVSLAHEIAPSEFTYTDHVFPILEKHCGDCHRPGGIAPMSLLSYQEAFPWAQSIKTQVLEARMPPWLPEDGVGDFRESRTLTAEEIDTLVDWASGGTPEGTAMDKIRLPEASSGEDWQLGEPDRILVPGAPVVVAEDELEKSVCLPLPTGLDTARWVRAFAFRAGNEAMVRRAAVGIGERCDENRRPAASWLPGQGAYVLPEGFGEPLAAGAVIHLRVHYKKTWRDDGKQLQDLSRLGLYFIEGAESVRSVEIGSRFVLSGGARLLSLYPLPNDDEIEVILERPDGSQEPLLRIQNFRSAWRGKLAFRAPPRLSAGSALSIVNGSVWADYVPVDRQASEP